MRTLGALLWPPLLFSCICKSDTQKQILVVPLLISTIWHSIELRLLRDCTGVSKDLIPSLRMEASALTGLGFAMSASVGNRPDSKYTYLFLYAVITCFLVVSPTHNIEQDSLAAQVIEGVQRSVFVWCMCLVIAGVLLSRPQSTSHIEEIA